MRRSRRITLAAANRPREDKSAAFRAVRGRNRPRNPFQRQESAHQPDGDFGSSVNDEHTRSHECLQVYARLTTARARPRKVGVSMQRRGLSESGRRRLAGAPAQSTPPTGRRPTIPCGDGALTMDHVMALESRSGPGFAHRPTGALWIR